jgi:hypothetical protein
MAGAGGGAAGRRPTVGDRVVLTPDYASQDDAASGTMATQYEFRRYASTCVHPSKAHIPLHLELHLVLLWQAP